VVSTSLKGATVVNTRPAHQAESLSQLISQDGGKPIEFPVIEISPPIQSEFLQTQLSTLNEANLAIFISANAVDAAVSLLGGAEHWPENVTIASVGRATSSKLKEYGLAVELTAPKPFNSEALLATPELGNISDKKIKIFRGEGGRALLGDTLRSRGANVDYVECYRRLVPDSDTTVLTQCWDEERDPIIVVTSNEGLRNLTKMIASEYQQNLLASPLVVVSERAVSLAGELGFEKKPELTTTVSNEAIVEAIQHRFSKK
jgi:uroporphyrinogen-III synthase